MIRVLGILSKVYSRLAAGLCCIADCYAMTGAITTHKVLFTTFLAIEMMAFQAMAGILCTNFLYSIACLVPSPTSLLVRLVITKVS